MRRNVDLPPKESDHLTTTANVKAPESGHNKAERGHSPCARTTQVGGHPEQRESFHTRRKLSALAGASRTRCMRSNVCRSARRC